jgi:hypothetical protein
MGDTNVIQYQSASSIQRLNVALRIAFKKNIRGLSLPGGLENQDERVSV